MVKKPFETVYELKNETRSVVGDQIPSFEEFMENYENDGNLNYDDLSGGSVGEAEGYGPCVDGRDYKECHCSREELQRQLIWKQINPEKISTRSRSFNVTFTITTANFEYVTKDSSKLNFVSWAKEPWLSYWNYSAKSITLKNIEQLKEFHDKIGNGVSVCGSEQIIFLSKAKASELISLYEQGLNVSGTYYF